MHKGHFFLFFMNVYFQIQLCICMHTLAYIHLCIYVCSFIKGNSDAKQQWDNSISQHLTPKTETNLSWSILLAEVYEVKYLVRKSLWKMKVTIYYNIIFVATSVWLFPTNQLFFSPKRMPHLTGYRCNLHLICVSRHISGVDCGGAMA